MKSIVAHNLNKQYVFGKQKIQALQSLNVEVEQGEIYGIIGPDGAGKTTLFRIFTSLLLADSGKVEVMGYNVVEDYQHVRKISGYMPGRFSLYQDLSVQENLEFFASVFAARLSENYKLIQDIYQHLEPFKHRRAGQLSGGMKQKLALCCALIHRPEILFLDEPTTGVDAVSRKEFWEMLKNIQKEGISIIVSTPYMDEAGMCDRISLIQEGRILSTDKPAAINKLFTKKLYAIAVKDKYQGIMELRKVDFVENVYPFGEFLHVVSRVSIDQNIWAGKLQENFISVLKIEANIEDVFMDQLNVYDEK